MASIFSIRGRKALAAVGIGIRPSASTADADVPLIISGAGVPSGDYGYSVTSMLYIRTNPADASTVLYVTHDGGTTWTAK